MVDNSFKVWQFADETDEDWQILKSFNEIKGCGGASDPSSISYEFHQKDIAAFLESIEAGRPFEIDGAEARKAVEIVLAIYTSAREGKQYSF